MRWSSILTLLLLPVCFGAEDLLTCKNKANLNNECLGFDHVIQPVKDTVPGRFEAGNSSVECTAAHGYNQPVMGIFFAEVTNNVTAYGVELLTGMPSVDFQCDLKQGLYFYSSANKQRFILNVWCVAGEKADEDSTNNYRKNLWEQIQKDLECRKDVKITIQPEVTTKVLGDSLLTCPSEDVAAPVLINPLLPPGLEECKQPIIGTTTSASTRQGNLTLIKGSETDYQYRCTPAPGDNGVFLLAIFSQYKLNTAEKNAEGYQIVASGDTSTWLNVKQDRKYRNTQPCYYMYYEPRKIDGADRMKDLHKIYCNSYKQQQISLNNAKLSVYAVMDQNKEVEKMLGTPQWGLGQTTPKPT